MMTFPSRQQSPLECGRFGLRELARVVGTHHSLHAIIQILEYVSVSYLQLKVVFVSQVTDHEGSIPPWMELRTSFMSP